MSWITFSILLLFEFCSICLCAIHSTPQTLTASPGQSLDLVCRGNLESRSCAFKPPYGTAFAVLTSANGASYENGRIVPYAGSSSDCGIRIQTVENKDSGEWKCYFGVDLNGEFVLGHGVFEVRVDGEASSVVGSSSFDVQFQPAGNEDNNKEQVFSNLREGEQETITLLIKAHSRPRSAFWNIGNTVLTVGDERGPYKSGLIRDGDAPGEFKLDLTIKKVTEEMGGKTYKVTVLGSGAPKTIKFRLEISRMVIEKPVFSSGSNLSAQLIQGLILINLLMLLRQRLCD